MTLIYDRNAHTIYKLDKFTSIWKFDFNLVFLIIYWMSFFEVKLRFNLKLYYYIISNDD